MVTNPSCLEKVPRPFGQEQPRPAPVAQGCWVRESWANSISPDPRAVYGKKNSGTHSASSQKITLPETEDHAPFFRGVHMGIPAGRPD